MNTIVETVQKTDKSAVNDALEDGEIQDDFEDISSDEEIVMRERIAELEARDKELQKIDSLVDTSYDYGIDYGKENQNDENFIEISDEEDELTFKSPLKKKKRVRKRKGVVKRLKSPTFHLLERTERHRLAVKKTNRNNHKKHEHSSRRKRNSAQVSSKRRDLSSDSSDVELDRSKLRAACRLEDRQVRNALKDKLSFNRKETDIIVVPPDRYEDEDEEELQLRLIALKSKQEIRDDIEPISVDSSPVKAHTINNSNEIDEERELRLEALKSTYVKKHQKRIKKRLENAERPYSPSDMIDTVVPCDDISTVPVDDAGDVLIIEKKPIMIEINDSENDEVDMEISPCYSPKSPSPQPVVVDMELADSKSPVQFDEQIETKVPSKPDSPVINDADKEEEKINIEVPSKPNSPTNNNDVNDEEEETALRALLLAKMTSASNSPSRKVTQKEVEPTSEVVEKSQESQNDEELRDLVLASLQNPNKKSKKPLCEDNNSNSIKIDAIHLKKAVKRLKEQTYAKDLTENRLENKLSTVLETEVSGIGSSNIPNVVKLKELATNLASKNSPAKVQNENDKALLPGQSPGTVQLSSTSISPTKKTKKRKKRPPQTPVIKKQVIPVPQLKKAAQQIVKKATKLINKPNKLVNLKTVPRQIAVKTVPKLIIQVGQSDSDSNSDYYQCSGDERETEKSATTEQPIVREIDNASPSRIILETPVNSPAPPQPVKTTANNTNSQPPNQGVEFQKNLDIYLKSVRDKVDQVHSKIAAMQKEKDKAETNRNIVKISTKGVTVPATPTAVRHLPKSSQIEYKRLVARMAQLEKQKQTRLKTLAQMSSNAAKSLPSTSKVVTPQLNAKKTVSSMENAVLQVTIPNSNSLPKLKKNLKNDLIVTINRDRRNVQDLSVAVKPLSSSTTPIVPSVAINNVIDNHLLVPNATPVPCPQPEPVSRQSPTPQRSTDEILQMKFEEVMEYLDTNLDTMNTTQRAQLLTNSENRYHSHCESFMNEMTEILRHVCIAQADREKLFDMENKLDYIKEKLAILEPLVADQKKKVNEHFTSLQGCHKDVIRNRKLCINLDQLCNKVGKNVQGDDYDIPTNTKEQIMTMLHLLTEETKKLKYMKKKSLSEFKTELFGDEENMNTDDGSKKDEFTVHRVLERNQVQIKPDNIEKDQEFLVSLPSTSSGTSKLGKYTSPLESLVDSGNSTNHDGIICPFQLMGRCEDRNCSYMHLDSTI